MSDKSSYFLMFFVLILVLLISYLSFIFSGSIENFLTGRVTSRAYITEPEYKNCSVNFVEGMNYVAFSCEVGRPLDVAMRNSANKSLNYSIIYSYNDLSSSPWRIYNKDLPDYVVMNLDNIYRDRGYVIFMDDSGVYSNYGIYSENAKKIPLSSGWNLIGFPLRFVQNVSSAIRNIGEEFISIKTYDETNKSWLSYYSDGSGDLVNLNPMTSYWINVNDDVLWVVD